MKPRRARLTVFASLLGLVPASDVAAQEPPGPWTNFSAEQVGGHHHHKSHRPRPLHNLGRKLKLTLVGDPDLFVEPPHGSISREVFGVFEAQGDRHASTLYQSDFIKGEAELSPGGMIRLGRIASEIDRRPEPVLVEWTPDRPELAESRKNTVILQLRKLGRDVPPDLIAVGPSSFPGGIGAEAAAHYGVLLQRSTTAHTIYTYPPNLSSSIGGLGGR